MRTNQDQALAAETGFRGEVPCGVAGAVIGGSCILDCGIGVGGEPLESGGALASAEARAGLMAASGGRSDTTPR